MAVSDQPRSEDELQALLSGESELSRRYREQSDEQPPAQIDAAIMASARWAVGADSRSTGSRRFGWRRGSTTGRGGSFMRWGAPLAMAAVVVVAVALTITIERDPELDRVYDKYDSALADARKNRSDAAVGESELASSELASSEMQVLPQVLNPPISAEPPVKAKVARKPAPASSPPPAEVIDSAARQEKEQTVALARKRSAQIQPERVPQSAEPDRQGLVAADIEASVLTEKKDMRIEQGIANEKLEDVAPPVQAFPQSDDVFADNIPEGNDASQQAGASASREEFVAGVSATADAPGEADADELMKSTSESSPDRQQPSSQVIGSTMVAAPERVDQEEVLQIAEAEMSRDPEAWIEDIEQLLREGRRDEAITSLEEFRIDYPDYALPETLQELRPAEPE